MTFPDASKGLMTRAQVVDFLSISEREVRRLTGTGELTTVRLTENGRPKYLRAEVEALVHDAINRTA